MNYKTVVRDLDLFECLLIPNRDHRFDYEAGTNDWLPDDDDDD